MRFVAGFISSVLGRALGRIFSQGRI